jgi:hypothetical protein
MATRKKEAQRRITFLDGTCAIEHDGDAYYIFEHCISRGNPEYQGTPREWMPSGISSRSLEHVHSMMVLSYRSPMGKIMSEALTAALDETELLIPPSLTSRLPA